VDVLVTVSDVPDIEKLRGDVSRWEALGVTGVLLTDHLFVAGGGPRGSAERPPDPVVVLAAIGALSGSLRIGSIVANVGLAHPALTLRHFAQMAALFGGERVIAGLGAGWNGEEFDALRLAMPPHAERVGRLEETLRLARSLFTDGIATMEGASVAVRDLPLSPWPASPPQLLVGGGSDRLLRLAAAYADWVDLNGSSRRQALGRTSPVLRDGIRRLTTTVADLEESVRRLGVAARDAGRPADAVRRSVLIDTIVFCDRAETAEHEQRLRRARHAPDAAVGQCPYVLIGPPGRQRDLLTERRERLGLSAVIVPDGDELERFMTEVIGPLGWLA
jgi:alkanesulfonate monooxygenase SsuD/methylene tetrahydromethanopterin reductase-like flavin-dependent oxidoreductase (luciferase family)